MRVATKSLGRASIDSYINQTTGTSVMKIRQLAFLGASLGIAAVALAAEDAPTKMKIAIADGDTETRIELNSDDLGFKLHDLKVGESRTVVDATGRTILVTRETDGFTFDVDGKTIKMPMMHGCHHGQMWMSGDDVDIDVMHHGPTGMATGMQGVVILSEDPIDDATQQAIKATLASAGHGSDVHFVERKGGADGPHRVHVIRKKVAAD